MFENHRNSFILGKNKVWVIDSIYSLACSQWIDWINNGFLFIHEKGPFSVNEQKCNFLDIFIMGSMWSVLKYLVLLRLCHDKEFLNCTRASEEYLLYWFGRYLMKIHNHVFVKYWYLKKYYPIKSAKYIIQSLLSRVIVLTMP